MMKRITLFAVVFLSAMLPAADAAAIIGRPLTPMSYAGVARRTTRRTVRRTAYVGAAATAATVATLPAGCGPYSGVGYNCGGRMYRPYYQGGNTVYMIDD